MSENYDFENYNNPKKKKDGGLVLAFVLVIVVCLTLGALLTALVINPMIESVDAAKQVKEEQQIDTVIEEEAEALDEAMDDASDKAVDIGGKAQAIQQYENPVVAIAQNMGPAVVGVRSSNPEFMGGQAVQEAESSYGSGVIISDEGYIVTNQHVVDSATMYTVVMSDGEEIRAELIGSDSFSDIAVLKIEADRELTVAPIGDSDAVLTGELAVAIGSPLGETLAGSVTVGYISAVNREVEGSKYLQTDAAINPGNSGGPLVNSKGEVIGINALKSYIAGYDETGTIISSEGIGFAIPINEAIEVAQTIIEEGSVERPGIGISYYPISEEDAELWEVPMGALVTEVTPGGPASIGGLLVDDIILGVEGVRMENPDELAGVVQEHAVGDSVVFQVYRYGIEKEIELTVVIGDLNKLP